MKRDLLQYELKQQAEKIGPFEMKIECLKDLNQTIDDLFAALEKEGNPSLLEELCPYFGTVWPSARALAQELVRHSERLRGKRLIELGCGLALPSLVAARLGALVTATDFHPEVPRFLKRNTELNEVSGLKYLEINWVKQVNTLGKFDWVIASDVLYERHQAQPLARAIQSLLAPGGEAMITDPARPYLQEFNDEMTRLGFHREMRVEIAPDHPKPKEIFILHFRSPERS